MNRRDFLKTLGMAGLAGMLPSIGKYVQAATPLHTGKVLLTLHAPGGWDQGAFFDPREDVTVNRWAATLKAGTAGNLRYAPIGENAEFFNKYYNYLLPVNGIAMMTNGHAAASRTRSTGSLAEGFPTTNELYAATVGSHLPMPFIYQGGFDGTVGIMPFTPLPDAYLTKLLTNPNAPGDIAYSSYYSPSHMDILERYENEQLAAQVSNNTNLPRWQGKLEELQQARNGAESISNLANILPSTLDTKDLKGIVQTSVRDLHTFLLFAAAGVTVTGSFITGSDMDSHTNNDSLQTVRLTEIVRLLDYLWTKAETLGVAERLIVHVTSDVGRTPSYNGNNGKDHWSVGNDLFMMKNAPWANRIAGRSGAKYERLNINPATLQPDASGIYLQTKHIHSELRKLLGIDTHLLTQRYNLRAENMGLFEPSASSGIQV
jgi:hypothetical protein